jgi:hypothetical protein
VIVFAAKLHVSDVGDRMGEASRSKLGVLNAQKSREEYEYYTYVETTATSAHVMQKIKKTSRRKPNM